MSFAEWVKRVKQTSMLLDILGKDVERATEPRPQTMRRIPFFQTIDTEYAAGVNYTQRERSWVNGGEDVHIQGVSIVMTTPTSLAPQPFSKEDAGYSYSTFVLEGLQRRYFDIGWNFRTSRTGGYYLTPANSGSLLSSTLLRKQRRDNFLWFFTPKVVKAGDILTSIVKPIRLSQSDLTPDAFVVRMVFFGYRNGALHERH